MKIIVLVGDGMGDYPVDGLGGKTPLQAASIPHIRKIAAAGRTFLVHTVPSDMEPGSDVANLSLLGYNPAENYTGRAPIEAAGANIPLEADDTAFRCNLVTVKDGLMDDYSAGHISTEEASQLIHAVDDELSFEGLKFYPGVSYRHLMVWNDGPVQVRTQPPHDIADKPAEEYLPSGDRSDQICALMEASKEILANHPVNQERIAAGKSPATQIWLWGQGRAMKLQTYPERYGLHGGIVSAVDLVRGLGALAGLAAPRIPDATGFLDTNFEGKVDAALEILDQGDFVYVHLEAPDECGHIGDADKKVEAIEAFDQEIVAPIWQSLEEAGEPVPMTILEGPCGDVDELAPFDEFVNGGEAEGMAYDILRELLRSTNA
jgi:2,3-bisphosphoglycerate-independent phosphoglycerate mutase